MIAALIIVFREMIEAGLIVGIVLAATKAVPFRGRWVSGGVALGVAGAVMVAVFAGAIAGAFSGAGQELFNASVLGLAVVMLAWHNVWMSRHGRAMAAEIKNIGEAVVSGHRTLAALALVVGLAVLREGSEVVLFLYGIAASGGAPMAGMVAGGVLGVILGGCVSALMYLGLLRIPAKHLFSVTSCLIILLAAGMAAQAAAFLQQAGIVTAFASTVWDTSGALSDGSLPGKALHTLVGYTARPSVLQLAVYLSTIGIIFVLMQIVSGMPLPSSTPVRKAELS